MPKIYTSIPPRVDGSVRVRVGDGRAYTFFAEETGGLACDVENAADAAEILALPLFFPANGLATVGDDDATALVDVDDDESPGASPDPAAPPARRRGRPPKAAS